MKKSAFYSETSYSAKKAGPAAQAAQVAAQAAQAVDPTRISFATEVFVRRQALRKTIASCFSPYASQPQTESIGTNALQARTSSSATYCREADRVIELDPPSVGSSSS
jgi:hypothetical protein